MQRLLKVLYTFFRITYDILSKIEYLKGDEDVQWEQCKKKLADIISLKCRGFGISNKVNYYIVQCNVPIYLHKVKVHITNSSEKQS